MGDVTILRPVSDGSYSAWTPYPSSPATLYDKVNEEIADDDNTYIENPDTTSRRATFNHSGIMSDYPIKKVTVKAKVKSLSGGTEFFSVLLVVGGVVYSLIAAAAGGYIVAFNSWLKNPSTNDYWKKDDINNLEFGVSANVGIRATQVWLEVEYVDNFVEISDGGTNQQEAVGMGAVYDPKFESATVSASLPISDTGIGVDEISNLLANMALNDTGQGTDNIGLSANIVILDDGHENESIILQGTIPITDSGHGNEVIGLNSAISVGDSANGVDITSIAKAYFLITTDNILQPLGVIVLRDSKEELLPGTRENTETIPGCDGEIDFGSEFQPRVLELRIAKSMDPETRKQLKLTFAKWLNPKMGAQPLIDANDIEKTLYVKYSGKIDPSEWLDYMEFTIPLKASDPFIIGSFEKTQVGSGTLNHEGTFESPIVITIQGPVTDPEVTIGSETMVYTGALVEGDTLVIDTGTRTAKFNGVNALANYNGAFPKLQPGETTVVTSGGTTSFTWRDRWI